MIIKFIIFLSIGFSIVTRINGIELKGLQNILNFINGEFLSDSNIKTNDEEDISATNALIEKLSLNNGTTRFIFIDFITFKERTECSPYEYIEYLQSNQLNNKSQIKIKCIPKRGNGTLETLTTMKDVMTLLLPHGNSTKLHHDGNCALLLFYTKSCPASANVAPHYNALSRQFPDLRIGAIDSYRFYQLNTEFGIVGLPTILLFHQGRPVVRFNESIPTVNNFIKFVTKHTGIEPLNANIYVSSEDFIGPLSHKVEKETDIYLYLSWIFIKICCCYYFTKSKLYIQFIEMIKRNWQESEESHQQ